MRDLTSPELDQCTGGAFVGVTEPVDGNGKIKVGVVEPFDPIDPPIKGLIGIAVPESLDPVDPIDLEENLK
jgi:hypothetical protein